MERFQAIEQTRFLGREFLLWLWFRSEQEGGQIELSTGTVVDVVLDDRLVLEPSFGEGNRHQLSGLDPATAPEAGVALRINKLPSDLKLKLLQNERAWAFSLRGDELQLRGLKIPEILSEADDERFYERMSLCEEIEGLVDGLFEIFLRLRLSGEWEDLQHLVEDWIKGK